MLSCLSWAEYCALPTHIPKLPHNSVASDPNYILTSAGYQNGYPCRVCSVVCEGVHSVGFPLSHLDGGSSQPPPSGPLPFYLRPELPQRDSNSHRVGCTPSLRDISFQSEPTRPEVTRMRDPGPGRPIWGQNAFRCVCNPFFLTVTYGPSQYHDIYGTLTNPLLIASPIL